MNDTLDSILYALAEMQRKEKEVKKEYENALMSIAPYQKALQDASRNTQQTEMLLKETLIENLISNGEQPNLPGVTLRHITKMEYEESDAVYWAMDNSKSQVLSIKKSEFNKVINELDIQPNFVQYNRIPNIAISQDLTSVLSKKETPGKTTKEQLLPEELR